jgi:hypothetical protein
MSYWIGVVGSREALERLRADRESWWCVPKRAKAGDALAIYVAKKRLKGLPEDQAGIAAIFEITGPEPERVADCGAFGGAFGSNRPMPVKILLRKRFATTLRIAEMKKDLLLAGAVFVRQSFQGTCFAASRAQFERISTLLELKQGNPKTSE